MPNKETNKVSSKSGDLKQRAPLNATQGNIELDSIPREPEPKVKEVQKPKRGLSSKSAMLHTYKEDVQSLVKDRKISMVRAMVMQSDKRTQLDGDEVVTISSKEQQPRGLSTKFIIIASILMVILGTAAIFIAYNAHQAQLAAQASKKAGVTTDDSLIFVEFRAKINVTDILPREILADLSDIAKRSNATLGSITQVLLQKDSYTLWQSELLQVLDLSLSDQFKRLLGKDAAYMVGVHVADRNTPFIILTTTSHEHAFAAMLEWEKRIEIELSPFFKTAGSHSPSRKPGNIVVKNITARVMRDEANNIRVLYSFLDDNTILITNNISTLTEVARRYNVRKASRPNY